MSKLKFSPNLFLEVAELDRFQDFIDNKGFRQNLIHNTVKFGLIKKSNDALFLNGKVQRDLDNQGGFKTIRINPIQAVDNRGLILTSGGINSIPIPSIDQWYWIRVEHEYSIEEVGQVTLAINGDLTGANTKFTEVLRGAPNFPSRIKFTNSQFNTLEYDVLEVIDDTHAIVMHPAVNGAGVATFEIESDLKYAVVGTFTPGVSIPGGDKYPFQYDSIRYDLIEEDIVNERPTYVENQQFYLARVKVDGDDVIIQDKRLEYWESQAKSAFLEIPRELNPLIGVEFIKWQNLLSPADTNQVHIAWGMRSQNWAVDSSKNIVTLFGSAQGGVFKTVNDFTNGDFDGWRVYTQNGKYSKVSSSIKQGQAINLTLDVLDVDNYSNDGGITFNNEGVEAEYVLIVPDVEEVELQFTPEELDENNNTSINYTFPVNTLIARCDIQVHTDPNCYFIAKYRYKTYKQYTEYNELPDDLIGYYAEASFDSVGNLKDVNDRVLQPQSDGRILLTISPNSYSILIDLIYKGDRIGVQTITSFSTVQVYSLRVKRDKRYQYITGDITLSDDVYISLDSIDAVEGNEFRIHLDCNSLNLNGRKIYIIREFASGSPVTLKEIGQGDVYEMMNQDGGLVFDCVYSDTNQWNVVYQNYTTGTPFEIKMLDGIKEEMFGVDGLGSVKGYYGLAICDGRNGTPDLVDRFVLGAGNSSDPARPLAIIEEQTGGGNNEGQLNAFNLPAHRHVITYGTAPQPINEAANSDEIARIRQDGGGIAGGYDNQAFTSTTGELPEDIQSFSLKNPYWALIMAKKLY